MVADTKDEPLRRLRIFIDKEMSDEMVASALKIKDTTDWKIKRAREVVANKNYQDLIKEYNYRIFDKNWVYYDADIIERGDARLPIMSNYLQNHILTLCASRRIPDANNFQHVFVSNTLADIHYISDQSYYFPLYLYKNIPQKPVFKDQTSLDLAGVQKELDESSEDKKSNIKAEIIQKLSALYKKQITSEEIFYYIYAILYSNIYRKKYNEFLKIDFPRIPFVKDAKLFDGLAELGNGLVNLHLLKSEKLENISAKFPVIGDNKVKQRKYSEKEKRLYINEAQYFENIVPEIWNYYIGGYQILDKWLKDRVNKILSIEDVNHFLKVITALNWTIKIQKEIDKLYSEVEKSII
jgi:predicted helicase